MITLPDLLSRLANVRRSGAGHTARCPAHDDGDNSLSVGAGDGGKVLLKCFAGCAIDEICAALTIDVKELFPAKEKKRRPARPERPLTLAELAEAKKLPVEFLRECGVEDCPDGSGVAIGYFLEDGSQHARVRLRTALRAKDGSRWLGPSGVAVTVYGLWRLKEWR